MAGRVWCGTLCFGKVGRGKLWLVLAGHSIAECRTDFFTHAIKFNFSILKNLIKYVKIREEKEVI